MSEPLRCDICGDPLPEGARACPACGLALTRVREPWALTGREPDDALAALWIEALETPFPEDSAHPDLGPWDLAEFDAMLTGIVHSYLSGAAWDRRVLSDAKLRAMRIGEELDGDGRAYFDLLARLAGRVLEVTVL